MSVVCKHVLTGRDVEMTRRLRDGKLLFTVEGWADQSGGIVLEIDPAKLKGAFGPRGIVVPPVKEAILTHRDCGCPISGEDGVILPCVCLPLIQHAFVSMLKSVTYLPNERCLDCAAPRAHHRDWRCELHNADPCGTCHPPDKGAAQ